MQAGFFMLGKQQKHNKHKIMDFSAGGFLWQNSGNLAGIYFIYYTSINDK